MNLIIVNTQRCLIELPPIPAVVTDGTEMSKEPVFDNQGTLAAKAEYRKAGEVLQEGCDCLKLKPGQNNVDKDYWERVCKSRAIKIWLAAGHLVNKGEGQATMLIVDINKLDIANAKERILECTNIGVLTGWADTAKPALKTLINARVDELIEAADGKVARGDSKPIELGTFGDGVTNSEADGNGEPSQGIGESEE